MRKKPRARYLTARSEPDPKAAPTPPTKPGTVQVGDIVTRRPITFTDKDSKNAGSMRGRVVYVHPKGRFHTVEFGEGRYAIRESFMGVER